MKQKLTGLKRKLDESRSIIGDFNTLLSVTERINKNNLGYRRTEQYYQPWGISQHLLNTNKSRRKILFKSMWNINWNKLNPGLFGWRSEKKEEW